MATNPISCLLLIIVTAVPCSSYSPAVIETTSLTATEGSCVEIKCKVTGDVSDEDALWFWMKDGTWDYSLSDYRGSVVYSNKIRERPISPQFEGRVTYTGSPRLTNRAGSHQNPSCSVLICDLTVQDSGWYFFRYIPKDPSKRWRTPRDAVLTVIEKPCPITFYEPAPVQDSSLITLTCSTVSSCRSYLVIESVPPSGLKTSWSWNSYTATATATVTASWEDDGREFICQTQGNKDQRLVKKTTITVQYKPRNTNTEIVGQSSRVAVGGSVVFKCNTKANPPAHKYYWYRGNNYHQTTAKNSLELRSVQKADEGCYSCSATNSVGQGDQSTNVCLEVLYGPQKVTVQADPGLTVKENETLTLHCSAQSHPPVTSVTWTRGNLTVHTGPTFSVESVSVSDSGLYSCTAHNEIGQGTSPPAEVKVKFGPKHTEVVRAEEVQSPDGSRSVTLSCSSHSFPPVSLYTWYRRTEGRELKVSENRTYTVVSTQPGVYYCTAKNNISETTSEPVSLFQDGGYVTFIPLALLPVLIILVAFFVYRLNRKSKSPTIQKDSTEAVQAETHRSRNVPGPQQGADILNDTSSINALYSTVNLRRSKQGQPATREQHGQGHSLNYTSLHKMRMPPKAKEDAVYSTVNNPTQEVSVYENITTLQNLGICNSDSSEDEVDVKYSQVNFRTKGRSREGPRLSQGEEAQYSELKI